MGAYDVPILAGVGLIAGYFILTNPELIQNLFPPANGDTTTDEEDGNGGDGEEENGNGNGKGGGGSSDCKKYCSKGWCESYRKKCDGDCSKCKGGGGSGGGGEFGETKSSKSEDCKNFCNKGWCESYRKRGCTGGCAACLLGHGGSCASKVISTNCGGDCKATCWQSYAGKDKRTVCVSKSILNCKDVKCSACQAARDAFCKKFGGCSRSNRARSITGQGLGRVQRYEDLFYPHNDSAMRVTIA